MYLILSVLPCRAEEILYFGVWGLRLEITPRCTLRIPGLSWLIRKVTFEDAGKTIAEQDSPVLQ